MKNCHSKTCIDCKKDKPEEDFRLTGVKKNYRSQRCKICEYKRYNSLRDREMEVMQGWQFLYKLPMSL